MNLAPSAALARTLTSVAFAAGLAACGGGGTSSVPVVPVTQPVVTPPVIPAPPVVPAAPATYLLGGTVSGMADGATITIVNGADSVTLAGNGSYSLPSRLLTNASYGVSSSTPAGHLCRINDGAGMVGTADVLKIDIKCMPFLLAGKERPFSRANAIATDGAGNTYVLDNLDQVILRIDSAGNSSVFAGTRNVRGSQDGVPGVGTLYTDATSRMAFDPQGNLIVADTCNGMIRRISPAGFISSLAGRPQNFCSATGTPAVGALDGVGAAAAFVRPSRIAIDASGTIMVASSSGRQLRRIDANRVVSTEDPFRAQTFSTISAMAFNQRGELFVAASGQSRIWRVDAGVGVVVAGTSGTRPAIPVDTPALSAVFNSIRALAFDKDGNLYIADSPTVRKLTTAGIVTSVAGSTANTVDGTGAGAFFSTVADLGLKSDGNLAVLQSDTSQLRTVTPAGVVTTSAATPYGREYADGKGAAARFSTGDYLAPAPDGSLYTLDAVNHVIRRIGADGTVRRAAGIAGTRGAADGPVASATMTTPVSLAVDKAGAVYFVDASGLRKLAGGVVSTLKADQDLINQAYFLRVLADGSFVYGGAEDVRILSASGELRAVIDAAMVDRALGLPSGTSAMSINGIEVDAAGNIYIADAFHAMLYKYTPTGGLSRFAGTLDLSGYGNGPVGAGSLTFETGSDLAIDAEGNLYLSGQGAVRKISAQGVISTPVLAWGRPTVFGIAVNNGVLYGTIATGVMQTPLP